MQRQFAACSTSGSADLVACRSQGAVPATPLHRHAAIPRHRADLQQCTPERGVKLLCHSSKGFGGLVDKVSKGFGKKAAARQGAKQEIVPVWEEDKKRCPCGSPKNYEDCCEPYHLGEVEPTAEALMRARFSAYVKGKVEYVVDSTHPDNPAAGGSKTPDGQHSSSLEEDVRATCSKIGWYRLKLLGSQPGSNEDEAFVEFQTWFKIVGQRGQRQKGTKMESMREKSRFLREGGRWRYVDGKTDWVHHTYQ